MDDVKFEIVFPIKKDYNDTSRQKPEDVVYDRKTIA